MMRQQQRLICGRISWRCRASLAACCFVGGAALAGCEKGVATPVTVSNATPSGTAASSPPTKPATPSFSLPNVAREAGIDFTYRGGAEAGLHVILQGNGGGCGFLDFDADGMMDLFFTGGAALGDGPTVVPHPSGMFRNLGGGKFAKVTTQSSLPTPSFYPHGCARGDYDNDGFVDLLVYGFAGVQLLRNQGDGSWLDVTSTCGLVAPLWVSAGAWGDLNGDGNLDLYLVNYLDWSWDNNPPCNNLEGKPDLCGPRRFNGLPDQIYHGLGDGTFEDVTSQSDMQPDGMGMAVLIGDVDSDNDVDVYVCNDAQRNFLYINDGGGVLTEDGVPRGAALNEYGDPNGSMGTELFDFDNDLALDMWVSNFERENCSLYRNQGGGLFLHVGQRAGITVMGQLYVCWGIASADLDHDGDLDVVVSNGHVFEHLGQAPREQMAVVLQNQHPKLGFRIAPFTSDTYLGVPHMGRGLAAGDMDNDGDWDLAISNIDEPVALLRNDTKKQGGWLTVKLVGSVGNRDAVGARVVLHTSAGDQVRAIYGGGSYCSQNDLRQNFGIPSGAEVTGLTIHWPSGQVQQLASPGVDRQIKVIEPRPIATQTDAVTPPRDPDVSPAESTRPAT